MRPATIVRATTREAATASMFGHLAVRTPCVCAGCGSARVSAFPAAWCHGDRAIAYALCAQCQARLDVGDVETELAIEARISAPDVEALLLEGET